MSAALKDALWIRGLIFAVVILVGLVLGIMQARAHIVRPAAATTEGETRSGLTAVRLIGQKRALEAMAKAAGHVKWTESHYDTKGRLVLPVPANYDPEDFGRLLEAIDPYTGGLQGLQMLGPHGGVVDDKGVEHADE